ncbi:MAG: hypothetical protein QXV98_03190 [Thermofilaceae archaeon]
MRSQAWVLRWPALPVLTDFVNTLVAKAVAQAAGAVEGVTFLQTPWFAEARVEVVDENLFRGSFAHMLRRGGRQLSQLKAMIVTTGTAGDAKQFGKVAQELGLSLTGEKTYDRIAALIKDFARRYGRGQVRISSEWKEPRFEDKVEVKLSLVKGRGFPLPSLVRSVSFYEGGRFSGFRDVKSEGPMSKGVFDVRCDASWWILTLAAAGASLIKVERTREENRYMFACFEPQYGVRYESLSYYQEFSRAVERFIEETGAFVEDEELFRLSLLFYVYKTLLNPLLRIRIGIKLREVRTGRRITRFTESYVTSISTGEIEILHRSLRSYVGGLAREAARACSELGRFVMITQRNNPTLARELSFDAFASKLKLLMRALSEPGYAPPSEPLYDMTRMMRMSEWRARFIEYLANRIEEWRGIPKEDAIADARGMYEQISELAATVAKFLR